jgi:DNA polymerase III delta prime subunit
MSNNQINFSHHAYCLEGDCNLVKENLFEILERDLKFGIKANPDFWLGQYDTFGIGDSREMGEFQIRKAVAGEKKVIVIIANKMTSEAQNSLLKTFEEPAPNTHFFLILPSSEILLPTLKSRLVIQKLVRSDLTSSGGIFLKASKKERLEIAKEMAEKKDRQGAIELLNQLEQIIYENMKGNNGGKGSKGDTVILETINKFRSYLNDRAPNLKMILEHLALVCPNT